MKDFFLVLIIDKGSALMIGIGIIIGFFIGFCFTSFYYSFKLVKKKKYEFDVLENVVVDPVTNVERFRRRSRR